VEEDRLKESDGGRCDSAREQSEAEERGEQPHDRSGNGSGMAHGDPFTWNVARLTGKDWLTEKA
jgi:hypothetical protein